MLLSVKVANLARFFPAWTVTREQWADMMMPSISRVAIDTLLFSRIGSPLCHRYRLISRTGSHAAFRGTYLRRLCAFLEESDSAMVRRLHHRLAQELATRVAPPADSPASVQPRRTPDCFSVTTTALPERSFQFGRGPESVCRLPAEMSSVHALMDLALPRFAGLADGPRQVHPPWSVASDSPASPAPARLETSGEDDSRCSVDHMSVSSTYLNLDALSSSSGYDSQELPECSDLSVTLFCGSEEAGTRVNSDQVSSDGDFLAELGARDIRQVVRQCASPPGGQIIGAAQDDRQHEPPVPVVDLVTGKCKPGKVSRTVSTTPLTLDLTVVCTSGVKVPPPGVSTQFVLPPATVASTVSAIGTITPLPLRLQLWSSGSSCGAAGDSCQGASETSVARIPPELLPLFRLSSSSTSPTLPWGAAEDSLRPFHPTVFRQGTLRMFRTRAVCSMCHRLH